ncbi:hypothetical protein N7462_005951 [Penicillium macrosclerotiorum]|uniref:uncharacterized protein n=1 Tax=Penicillium macrosclerotiorum TaxID=303699 RepID=UPI002547AA58|nr:uncharacterized protein N7462_005951 [Penicillium macrosclerotiorum]KAJ5682786.1 hypothetical protein N7462_005951 [Penicillium macrosclerotiorum]
MVYCGKPSKGCGQCRTRKIRCDQARPACSQCVRAKRDCPGYRDQLSLMFRDESKSVVQKAEANTSNPSTSRHASNQKRPPGRLNRNVSPDRTLALELTAAVEPSSFDFNLGPLHSYASKQLYQLPMEIQPLFEPSKEEAISYFLRSNAVPGTVWMSDFVTNFISQAGGSASAKAMQSSIIAVASAMLCRVRKITSLARTAQDEYVLALKLLNAALADVEEAKSNQTLGAVVLLAIYEVVTSRSPQDIDLWTNHITGATALLDLRGTDQLKTEVGLRLFLHLRYQVIISCIQRDSRVPNSLLECTKFAMFLRPGEAHSNRLIIIIGRLSNLRADMEAKILTDEGEIIAAASSIEADLIGWLAALPPNSPTRPIPSHLTISCSKNDAAGWPLTMTNTIIILISGSPAPGTNTGIILSHIWKMSNSSSPGARSDELRLHCKALRATMRRLAVDICRSVPYHLGATQKDGSPHFPPPESYIGGLMLLWPLFLAGITENAGHALRRWVVQCLKMVGHSYGFDQALALMDIVAYNPGMIHSVIDEEKQDPVVEEQSASPSASPASKPTSLLDLDIRYIPTSTDANP